MPIFDRILSGCSNHDGKLIELKGCFRDRDCERPETKE